MGYLLMNYVMGDKKMGGDNGIIIYCEKKHIHGLKERAFKPGPLPE
jgi:hypothetical protein